MEGGREQCLCEWPKLQDAFVLKSSSIFGVGLTCPAYSRGSVGLTGVLGHEFLCFASCLIVVLQYPLGLPVGNWSYIG